jgi:uncharacterized protein (DUF1800 family)
LVPAEASSQNSGEVWLYRMRNTPYPFIEKATLFWHDFFGVAGSRVKQSSLMERHLEVLRKHALGRFDHLLSEVAHDPAMLIAKGPPSMLERAAFSGVTVLRGEYHYQPSLHHGDLSPDDAVRQALAQPEISKNVVRRTCRWLLGKTDVDAALLEPLANEFARDYNFGKLVATVVRSKLFFSRAAYRQGVKSPVEFAFNLAIAMNAAVAPAQLHAQLAALGQPLPEPSAGRRWLNAFTIVGRSNLAAAMIEKVNHFPDRGSLLATLLQNDAPPAVLEGLAQLEGRELAQAIANLPEFQLA